MPLLRDITLGQYYPGNSILHGLDPRTKFISILMLMSCLFISMNVAVLLSGVALVFLCIVLSGLPVRLVLKNLRPFKWLFLVTFFVHALTTPGQILFDAGITVTLNGIVSGLLYTVRLSFLIVIAALFTLTTQPSELTDALDRLLSPLKRFKVPVHELVLMSTLSLRFLPILLNEGQRLKNAQLSRGASLEGTMMKRIKALIPMILPLFVSAIRRADDLALAMEARNYTGGAGRSSYHELCFGRKDILAFGFSATFLMLSVYHS